MLTSITLQNFKIFKEKTTFPLSKINLLTGTNGSGKSSLLQSLLLMRQSIEHNENTADIFLNGSCVRLGTFEDVRNKEIKSNDTINFLFSFIVQGFTQITNEYTLQKKREKILNIKEINISSKKINIFDEKYHNIKYQYLGSDNDEICNIFLNGSKNNDKIENMFIYGVLRNLQPYPILKSQLVKYETKNGIGAFNINHYTSIHFLPHYISADRIGAKDFYQTKDTDLFQKIDKQGEYTVDIIAKNENRQLHENLCLEKESNLLKVQIGKWLSQILDKPNTKIIIDADSNDFIITLKFEIDGQEYKPSNVGFGYSYILPIVVAGLVANEGEILIIENPEAHLHPKAQSQLAKFLAKVASCGVQVFVESHSEHILNALRVAIVQEEYEITNEDVSVLYFDSQFEEGKYFEKIEINEKGQISNWLDGFFDQTENDLDILLGLG